VKFVKIYKIAETEKFKGKIGENKLVWLEEQNGKYLVIEIRGVDKHVSRRA